MEEVVIKGRKYLPKKKNIFKEEISVFQGRKALLKEKHLPRKTNIFKM